MFREQTHATTCSWSKGMFIVRICASTKRHMAASDQGPTYALCSPCGALYRPYVAHVVPSHANPGGRRGWRCRLEYARLDGSMTVAARDVAVRSFQASRSCNIFLVSLKAASLGLNLVAANHVVLLDLWWNPAVEEQAIDRAHRIGQNRPVYVTRITIKDTIEERILKLQEKKRQLINSTVEGGVSGPQTSRLTAEDLEFLFAGM
eukprot:jgi/Botrbrau1/4377/Bobra.105_2s0023.1